MPSSPRLTLTMARHLSSTVFFSSSSSILSLCRPHPRLNAPSLFLCVRPSPTSHDVNASSVLRCVYYRGPTQSQSHPSPPLLPARAPQTLSLALYCLWSCFIMSSYMHIIEACPSQAAWLRWNIWIIYHLQSALPHFRKFFPAKSQNY